MKAAEYTAAVHEAGHAIAAWLFGRRVFWVRLYESGPYGGRTRRSGWPFDAMRPGEFAEEIVIDLAGGAAEGLLDSQGPGTRRRVWAGSKDDMVAAKAVAKVLGLKRGWQNAYYDLTQVIMMNHWGLLRTLADMLYKQRSVKAGEIATLFKGLPVLRLDIEDRNDPCVHGLTLVVRGQEKQGL